jgi:hypothetical protein
MAGIQETKLSEPSNVRKRLRQYCIVQEDGECGLAKGTHGQQVVASCLSEIENLVVCPYA